MTNQRLQFPPSQAVILAAGRGTRLRPYTDQTPKPLLSINGRPMLETVFLALQEAAVQDVCVVVHHLALQIEAYAGDGAQWGLHISYAYQEKPVGTADAVRCAADFIKATTFILAADYALPRHFLSDLRNAYIAQSAPLFASLKELSPAELSAKSSVRFGAEENGRIIEIVEKPAPGQAPSSIGAAPFLIVPASIGPYLADLRPSIRGEYELIDVLNRMIEDGWQMNGRLQPQPPEWEMTITSN